MSVLLFDYVAPSPLGSTWGLGGTCVNVGCIPKKLFHLAAQGHYNSKTLEDYGWKMNKQSPDTHDWQTLRNNVQGYIKSINLAMSKKWVSLGLTM